MWTTHKIEGAGGVGGGSEWISESQQLYTAGYANAYWDMNAIDVKPDGSSIVLSGYANRTPASPADGQYSAQTILLDEDGSFVISKWNRYGGDTNPVLNSVRFGGDGWIYTATTGQPGSGRTIYSRNETTLAYGTGNGKYVSSGAIYTGSMSGQGSMNYIFGQQRPSPYIDGLISSYSGTNDSNQYLVIRRQPGLSAITFNSGYVANNTLYAVGLNDPAGALFTYNTGGGNGIGVGLKYNNVNYVTQFFRVTADSAGNIYTAGVGSSIPFVTKWTSGGGIVWTKQIYHASYNLGINFLEISPTTGDLIVTAAVAGTVGTVFLSLDSANGSINWQFGVKSSDCTYTGNGGSKIDDNGIIYCVLNLGDYPNPYAKIAVIKFDLSDVVNGTFGDYVCAPTAFISQNASYTSSFAGQQSASNSISSSTETGTQGTFAYNFTPISL
tara:strand:- start:401 stop:1723 length:1323 start_codon:yes stop_codon:yes gene_type:complete